ncbi:hypothetical protein [Rhodococcus tibetensis]|uniref:Uncharacterized protein n=1 Tax=Rhodococcus tibetensis TaxID=2965064 RepID=A0ABT1Q7T5_9NOCA|nr:hypothetical protein [Rhodococcus sp. FXJ9.536]MCQ4118313.1 hypothetical protein [Rhodococcus sp. FXJ9.536]
MVFFGRPGGPARTVLALVAVGVLGLLSVVIFNLNRSLENQQRVNATSVGVSESFLDVNDQLTAELGELTQLTGTAESALDSIRALGPLLARLDHAITPVAASLSSTAQGAQITNEQLAAIAQILGEVHNVILPLVDSAQAFGQQGEDLLAVIEGLIADLQTAVESAATINQMLPLPG